MTAYFFLHPRIIRPTAAFWCDPDDVLRRVFDVAGFAVDAVLGVDLQAICVVFVFDVFVHTRWAVAAFGAVKKLYEDRGEIKRIGIESRAYVQKHYSMRKTVDFFLQEYAQDFVIS